MKTNFLVILLTFLFSQTFGLSIIATSSNVTCIQKERESLLLFKQALTDSYHLLSTWSGLECCEWHGVGCDSRNGHIVKLDLRSPGDISLDNNCLGGELSHSLQNLKHLRYLDLSINNFSGNIPEFLGSFERLEYLNLSRSGFSGIVPHHLGNLSRLQYLDFKNCFAEYHYYDYQIGTLYSKFVYAPIIDDLGWVASLSSLKYLDLSGITIGNHTDWLHPVNMLPSLLTLNLAWSDINIPFIKFANFTSLSSLDLSLNDINSTIPVWLSNLTGLMHLNLQSNRFHGKVPEYFGMFNALASLDLSVNSFETSMPELLCNLSNLVRLDLSENMFTGRIPASLGLLSRLEYLYLNDNQLSGNIPMSLGKLSNLKNLDLSFNSLAGVLSEIHFTKLKNLSYLALSSNSLALNFSSRWIAPFQLKIFLASSCNNGPHFPNWLKTQTNLQALHLSNSSIRDTLPEWFENILSRIVDLDLSNNKINGKLPRFHFRSSNSTMDGILRMNSNKFEGSIATFPSNVRTLDLSDNLLSGHVPQTDGTMNRNLEFVNLSKNRFKGIFPIHLCELPSIYFLDLSDNLLSGHVPQAEGTMNPNLQVVNLSKNRFTGSIPVDLCKVHSIEVLDLSQNKFSGKLPGCLGNLISLQAMDLSNNTITGSVPSSLGSLTKLESLHLHNNKFEGNLPLTLQNLTGLVTMDIGNNYLVGTIPFWIGENLSSLRILNLQSNKFTGKIPLQLCQLNALQHLNLAQNNLIGTIPRCFSNLSGMITNQVNLGYYVNFYEEHILAYMKGIQLVYTKTIQFLTTLDLSSNNITGEIPDVLMNLVGLKNLNLSRNQLKGHVPMTIGNLGQMESLDLSMNMLCGPVPQSLTSLNFLSYLNLSFNNLSGAIPIGNQLQTLADPSVYAGNDGLCGPPVSRSCKGNNSSYNHVGEDESQDEDERLWFYSGMGSGFVAGFTGLVGSLYFMRTCRLSYFKILENVYGWLNVLILLNLARLRRKFF